MLAIGDVVLRATNFVFLVIVLGLTGSLAATTIYQSNPQVNFAVFAAAFGILTSSIYGVFAFFFEALAWPVVLGIFDFLNFVFTFAAACALATAIRVHSCKNNTYLDKNHVAQGKTGRCRKAQCSVAFLFFSAFIFIAALGLSFAAMFSGGMFKSRKSSARTGVPAMTQV